MKVVCPDCGKEFEVETPQERWRKKNRPQINEYQRNYMRGIAAAKKVLRDDGISDS
jgi:uncharacterized Zn finger protein (UPF0148 family)